MDIQQAPLIVANKRWAKDTHVARQHHQIGLEDIDLLHQLAVEGFAAIKRFRRERKGRNTGLAARSRPNASALLLNTARRVPLICFRAQASIIACKLLPLPEISTTMFSFNDHALFGIGCLDVTDFRAFSPCSFSRAMALSTSAAGSATSMPTPQLKVRYISWLLTLPAVCSQLKTSGHCRRTRRLPRVLSGSTRGIFSQKPPPVRWAMAWTSTLAIRFRIDLT